MNLKTIISEQTSHLQQSPVSIFLKSGKPLPVQTISSDLADLNRDMKTIAAKLNQPLKIVIMGEVKAGKSTLINTMVGQDVSPVNVKEATASIIVIHHKETAEGTIVQTDGTSTNGSPAEIFEVLKKHHGDMDFFSNCLSVFLGFPLPNLQKFQLVDTPGLATVTTQNEALTNSYMQDADVVLWVLNGNHIGQMDVEEALAKVAKMGKPILAVINRIDEIDGDPVRLLQYVEQQIGIYVKAIFPLSAYEASQALKSGNTTALSQSGYTDILAYLEEQIEQKAEKVHKESILTSIQAVLRKNLVFHESYARSLQFIKMQIREQKSELDYHNNRIKQELEDQLKQWVDIEFLRREKSELHGMIEGLGIMSGKQDKSNIVEKMQRYFSSESINNQLYEVLKKLEKQMQEEWQSSMKTISENRNQKMLEFVKQEESEVQLALYEALPSGQELAMEGAGKGAAIAGAWGATAAAYAAWFGPYASTISLGAAAGAILPPLLIAGAITGAVAKLVSFTKQKRRYQNDLDQAFSEAKLDITHKVIPNIVTTIRKVNDEQVAHIQAKFIETLSHNTENDFDDLVKSIAAYCDQIKSNINRLESLASSDVVFHVAKI